MTTAATARVQWASRYVGTHCFGAANSGGPTIGAEMEFIALDLRSRAIAPIFARAGRSCTLDVVRAVARQAGWRESVSDKGVPGFTDVRGGTLTFEPGGQLEYASAVHHSVDTLSLELDTVESLLRRSAQDAGIDLLSCGVDPCNGAGEASLQLTADRYARMAEYFAGIGPDGARMMRQTASVQVNIGGVSVIGRWSTANALAPVLTALFANSARYARHDTGYASYRAETWRGVDPGRTGAFAGDDPVAEYATFALGATAFLAADGRTPFGLLPDWEFGEGAFATHLSTLFPEVRPRRYLEFRCIDAVDRERRHAALVLVAGIMLDDTALEEARRLLPRPTPELLRAAGRSGLRDESLGALAREIILVGLAGARRLDRTIVSAHAVERAAEALLNDAR